MEDRTLGSGYAGLVAAARWALMAPIVVLEGRDAFIARERSSHLVRGQTGAVMAVVVVTFLVLNIPFFIFPFVLPGGPVAHSLAWFIWSSLTAPFDAHVLTVVYYRLTDPKQPVIHDDVLRWRSVWDAA